MTVHENPTPPREEKLKAVERLIRQQLVLPSLPQVVSSVRKAIQDDSSSARDLAGVILQDPPLTARLIRMANSVYYRRTAGRISTVTHAIIVLGFETLRNLTFGLTVYKYLSGKASQEAVGRLWHHSLSAALVCQFLSERNRARVPEEAFVAGLLHDVGILIMWMYAKDGYAVIEEAVARGESRVVAEEKLFGFTHCEAGEVLARYWGFPDAIVNSVRFHHEEDAKGLDPKANPYFDMLAAADATTAALFGYPAQRETWNSNRLFLRIQKVATVSKEQFDGFFSGLDERIRYMAGILEMPVGEDAESDLAVELTGEAEERRPAAFDPQKRRERQLRAMTELTAMMMEKPDSAAIVGKALASLKSVLACNRLAYASWDAKKKKYWIRHGGGDGWLEPPRPWTIDDKGAHGQAVEALDEGKPCLMSNVGPSIMASLYPDLAENLGHTSTLLIAPVLIQGRREGAILGEWYGSVPELFPDDYLFLQGYGTQVAMILSALGDPHR